MTGDDDDLDDSVGQLVDDLDASVADARAARRPLLHHLTADSTWLLQLPRPASKKSAAGGTRKWYNILIDPWLAGVQIDYFAWFSRQWHTEPAAAASPDQVEELLAEAEDDWHGDRSTPLIDLILISHEFTDHMHKQTLLQCHAGIPVVAAGKAAALIRSWKHFRIVLEAESFGPAGGDGDGDGGWDWHALSVPPLPDWVAVGRLVTRRDTGYLHAALVVVFETSGSGSGGGSGSANSNANGIRVAEAIVYTPHGTKPATLAAFAQAHPDVRTLALLHGLHDIRLALGGKASPETGVTLQQLNLGAPSGLAALRALRARYWVPTHDEEKRGRGVIGWLLRRRAWTVDEAMAAAEADAAAGAAAASHGTADGDTSADRPTVLTVRNGESAVLA